MLVARVGLRVSPEGLCKTSIWVQLLLCGGGFLLPLLLRTPGLAVLPMIGTAFHVFNLVAVYRAEVRRTNYPWHRLKWSFPLGAAAYCLAGTFRIVGAMSTTGRISLLPLVWLAAVYFIPPCLQTALLWWREVGHRTVEEMEP